MKIGDYMCWSYSDSRNLKRKILGFGRGDKVRTLEQIGEILHSLGFDGLRKSCNSSQDVARHIVEKRMLPLDENSEHNLIFMPMYPEDPAPQSYRIMVV